MCPMAHLADANGIGLRHLRALFAAVAVVVALASLSAAADARTSTPGMSLGFASKTARVAGPGALVLVRCAGSGSRECAGTLTVEGLSESHSVSYSVARGERRSIVVPLGAERDFFTGIAAPKMRVVAETMQSSGGSVRT